MIRGKLLARDWPCFVFPWFQFSWFFFELIVKSMAQHLLDSDKVKVRWRTLLIVIILLQWQFPFHLYNLTATSCFPAASEASAVPLILPEPRGDAGGDGVRTHLLEKQRPGGGDALRQLSRGGFRQGGEQDVTEMYCLTIVRRTDVSRISFIHVQPWALLTNIHLRVSFSILISRNHCKSYIEQIQPKWALECKHKLDDIQIYMCLWTNHKIFSS